MQSDSYSGNYPMDVLAIASFLIGLKNYGENLDQSKAQDMLNNVLKELHGHLREQDEKIDKIMKHLEIGG